MNKYKRGDIIRVVRKREGSSCQRNRFTHDAVCLHISKLCYSCEIPDGKSVEVVSVCLCGCGGIVIHCARGKVIFFPSEIEKVAREWVEI
jgi:hypothetical protein